MRTPPRIYLFSPHMGTDEFEFVREAFATNWIAPLGPRVDAFEREFAALVDSPHAAALSSGTAAVHLSLRLLGLKPGEEVFCSSLTFSACAPPNVKWAGIGIRVQHQTGTDWAEFDDFSLVECDEAKK